MLSNTLLSQTTWQDIAPIIYTNCSSCHHAGAIAPFSLMSYEEVVFWTEQIVHEVYEGNMPPWPPDPNYRSFANEHYLSEDEKTLIIDWLLDGAPEGNPSLAPYPPTFPENGILMDPVDFIVEIEPYTLQSNEDEYRWFSVANPFEDTIYINKIEVVPGLETVVHHADLAYDVKGINMALDLTDPLPGFNNTTGNPVSDYYVNAWAPGANIATYPENWGVPVPPEADFLVEIHYGPNGIGQTDSTKIYLQFTPPSEVEREMTIRWYLQQTAPQLIDGPFFLPANEFSTFHQQSPPLAVDMSLVAICPHMHFLGHSYKVWAETPDNITIPLIDITNWDFHWQKYYYYPYVQRIPAGSIIYSEGVYNNTTSNHDNPNYPPIDVGLGLNTDDEMFLCLMIYADYQAGDENISMQQDTISLSYPESTLLFNALPKKEIQIYPNPVQDILNFETNLYQNSIIEIRNQSGQLIKSVLPSADNQIDISELKSGVYFLNIGGQYERFVKTN